MKVINTKGKANKAFLISATLFLAAYIVLLLIHGYPLPYRDDLLFLGTPINAIQNGHFSNPYCSGFLEQLGTLEHLYYMPGQVWLLYSWFKLIGISTVSVLIFQWVGYGIGMVSLYALATNKFKLSSAFAVLLAAIYLTILIPWGLRPDAWGFGLTFAGLAIIRPLNFKRQVTGIMVGGLGALCAPLSCAIFIPLALYLGLNRLKIKNWWTFVLAGLIALSVNLLLLGMMIQFRFQLFFEIFTHHSSLQKDGLNSFVQFVMILHEKYNLILKLPLFGIAALMSLITISTNRVNSRLAACLLASLLLSIALYAEKTVHISGQIICWILLALGYQVFSSIKLKWAYVSGLYLLFFVTQSAFFIALIGQKNNTENKTMVLTQSNGFRYVVGDAVVARTIYDYKLPNRYKSLEFHTKDYYPSSIKECAPDEVWIFSARYSIILPQDGIINPPKLKVMGKEFASIPKNEFLLQIVEGKNTYLPKANRIENP